MRQLDELSLRCVVWTEAVKEMGRIYSYLVQEPNSKPYLSGTLLALMILTNQVCHSLIDKQRQGGQQELPLNCENIFHLIATNIM
jgi:hypothetical protein